MQDWYCPSDAICLEEPTCMYCGEPCDNIEVVYTGDEESYGGFKMWCYCEHCQADTFHKLTKDTNNKEK